MKEQPLSTSQQPLEVNDEAQHPPSWFVNLDQRSQLRLVRRKRSHDSKRDTWHMFWRETDMTVARHSIRSACLDEKEIGIGHTGFKHHPLLTFTPTTAIES